MSLIDRFVKRNLIICIATLCMGILCANCSSKGDKDKKDKAGMPSADSKRLAQVQENLGLQEQEKLRMQESAKKDIQLLGQKNEVFEKRTQMTSNTPYGKTGKNDKLEANKLRIDAVIAKFNASDSSEEKKELMESLDSLSSAQDPSLIKFVRNALDDTDPEVGQAAIELLEDYGSPEILPVIAHALEAEEADTRAEAVALLSDVNDSQVNDLINTALDDDSENVREAALEVVEELRVGETLGVMLNGISSPYNDVKYEIVSILEDRGDHNAVDIIIEGLRDNDPAFCEEVNETLEFLIDQKFETYEDARFWWGENKHLYDKELFKMEDGD